MQTAEQGLNSYSAWLDQVDQQIHYLAQTLAKQESQVGVCLFSTADISACLEGKW